MQALGHLGYNTVVLVGLSDQRISHVPMSPPPIHWYVGTTSRHP